MQTKFSLLLAVGTVCSCLTMASPAAWSQVNQPQPATETVVLQQIATPNIDLLHRALDILSSLEGGHITSLILGDMAAVAKEFDNTDQALALLERAQIVAETIETPLDQAYALSAITKAYGRLGHKQQALNILNRAFSIAQSDAIDPDDPFSVRLQRKSDILNDIAQTYIQFEKPQQALMALAQSRVAIGGLGDFSTASPRLVTLAQRYGQLNETAKAVEVLDHAVERTQEIEGSHNRCEALSELALGYDRLGEGERAQALLEAGLHQLETMPPEIMGSSGDRTGYYAYVSYPLDAYGLHQVVGAASKLQDTEQGSTLIEKAKSVADSMGFEESKASAWHSIAIAYTELDQKDQALAALEQVQAMAAQVNWPTPRTDVLVDSAITYYRLGERQQALATLEETLRVSEHIGFSLHRVYLLTDIARVYHHLEQSEQALAVMENAVSIVETIEEDWAKSDAIKEVTRAYGHLGYGGQTPPLGAYLAEFDGVSEGWEQDATLHDIAASAVYLEDVGQGLAVLEDVMERAETLEDEDSRTSVLLAVANAMVILGNSFGNALRPVPLTQGY